MIKKAHGSTHLLEEHYSFKKQIWKKNHIYIFLLYLSLIFILLSNYWRQTVFIFDGRWSSYKYHVFATKKRAKY